MERTKIPNKYNVVFEYTANTGGYAGVRTWTAFEDKKAFDKWYTPEIQKENTVLKEGVTEKEAQKLCSQTHLQCDIGACVEAATDKTTGKVNKTILEIELSGVAIIRHVDLPSLYSPFN